MGQVGKGGLNGHRLPNIARSTLKRRFLLALEFQKSWRRLSAQTVRDLSDLPILWIKDGYVDYGGNPVTSRLGKVAASDSQFPITGRSMVEPVSRK